MECREVRASLVKEQRREIQSLAKKDQYWRPKIEGVGDGCHWPSRPPVLGTGGLHACFRPLPLTPPHFLSASQPLAARHQPPSSARSILLAPHKRSSPRCARRWKCPAASRQAPLLGAPLPWPPVRHLQTCRRPGHHHPILTLSAPPGFNPSRPFSPGTEWHAYLEQSHQGTVVEPVSCTLTTFFL